MAEIIRAPIPLRVLRWRCPNCTRSASRPGRIHEHMACCWYIPENRGCMTCVHFEREPDACGCEPGCNWGNSGGEFVPERCAKGVDLSGRPACTECGGFGSTIASPSLGVSECGACGGDAAEVKAGPIIHCDLWQPNPTEAP
jgi:hypothetical protein